MAVGRQTKLNSLRQLARACGIQTSYIAMSGKRRQASAEAMQAVLRALGEPLDRIDEAGDRLHERRLEKWRRMVEPVTVAWDGRRSVVEYYPAPEAGGVPVSIELLTEQGETHHESFQPDLLKTVRREAIGGAEYPVKAIPLPKLPWGYHTLRVEAGGKTSEAMIIAAPLKAHEPAHGDGLWGLFLPLYALATERSWGAGDLGDFEQLVDWVKGLGGGVAATLPLLAAFLSEPFDPSPYVPASRLFWNEFYIDMARVPELEHSPAARALLESDETRRTIRELRGTGDVDYWRVMALKRRVLRELALEFFSETGHSAARTEAYQHFIQEYPKVEDYAAFRAACERQHGPWCNWPEPLKQGVLGPADYDEDVKRTFLYAQFIMQEQMDHLSSKARAAGPGLYLDMPLGVHPDSYDVWRERDSFAWGVSGGAPPDAFFSKGQDWGFAPLHPLKIRERRYGYIIECVQRLMRQAGVVRIDHVMGLHRLFWVPQGMEATQGVYVKYPAEELHAILNVESRRRQSMIVGEDLGTVPGGVRRAMQRHNLHGMYVLQFCIQPENECLVAPVPEGVVASANTHDMPSFAGFWQGKDIDDQVDLGLVKPSEEEATRARRAEMLRTLVRFYEKNGLLQGNEEARAVTDAELPRLDVIRAMLEFLGRSPAKIALVNLEDLWQELNQQNVPGTCEERRNWQHKARYTLEEFSRLDEVRELLEALDRARREVRKKP